MSLELKEISDKRFGGSGCFWLLCVDDGYFWDPSLAPVSLTSVTVPDEFAGLVSPIGNSLMTTSCQTLLCDYRDASTQSLGLSTYFLVLTAKDGSTSVLSKANSK